MSATGRRPWLPALFGVVTLLSPAVSAADAGDAALGAGLLVTGPARVGGAVGFSIGLSDALALRAAVGPIRGGGGTAGRATLSAVAALDVLAWVPEVEAGVVADRVGAAATWGGRLAVGIRRYLGLVWSVRCSAGVEVRAAATLGVAGCAVDRHFD